MNKRIQWELLTYEDILMLFGYAFLILLSSQLPKTKATLMEYWFLIKICKIKVDFGDFSFLHIKPKAVRYVSGVATALLGSGGMRLLNSLEEI